MYWMVLLVDRRWGWREHLCNAELKRQNIFSWWFNQINRRLVRFSRKLQFRSYLWLRFIIKPYWRWQQKYLHSFSTKISRLVAIKIELCSSSKNKRWCFCLQKNKTPRLCKLTTCPRSNLRWLLCLISRQLIYFKINMISP